MKKVYALFLLLFTSPLLASGIGSDAASAPCDDTTLETYGGTSNLEVDWQPNVIETRWYNGNTQIAGPTSCTYDDVLNVPSTTLTKTGYTFIGWEVIPEYDFSTLDTSKNGIHVWSKTTLACWYGDATRTTATPCNNGQFNDLNIHEWKGQFEYGKIYGTTLCTSTTGTTLGDTGNPNESTSGVYCWVKVTGFVPNNNNTKYAPNRSPKWAFIRSFDNNNHCINGCADWASFYFITRSNLRNALFN